MLYSVIDYPCSRLRQSHLNLNILFIIFLLSFCCFISVPTTEEHYFVHAYIILYHSCVCKCVNTNILQCTEMPVRTDLLSVTTNYSYQHRNAVRSEMRAYSRDISEEIKKGIALGRELYPVVYVLLILHLCHSLFQFCDFRFLLRHFPFHGYNLISLCIDRFH